MFPCRADRAAVAVPQFPSRRIPLPWPSLHDISIPQFAARSIATAPQTTPLTNEQYSEHLLSTRFECPAPSKRCACITNQNNVPREELSSFPIAAQPHCCAIRPTHLAAPHHSLPDDALEKRDDNCIIAVLVFGMILSRAVMRLASFRYRSAPAAKRLPSPEGPLCRGSAGPPNGGAEARHCLRVRTTAPPPAPDEPTGPSHGH